MVADDVNLPLGRLRLRARGSAGGHNGLKSIIECLGTDEFPRLRVGVGRGDPRRDLADHVLARFDDDERTRGGDGRLPGPPTRWRRSSRRASRRR